MTQDATDLLHLHTNLPFTDSNLEGVAYQSYRDLLQQIEEKRLHPLRFWNFVSDINHGSDRLGDGENERYKLFNRGRRRAWLEYDPSLKAVCASTCVGSREQNRLDISCLATQLEVTQLDNPNQIPFSDYSDKYGTPPSSRRGSLHITPKGVEVWISGTASIIGEETRFTGDKEPKDLVKQLNQTLENIKALISDKNLSKYYPAWKPRNLSLKDLCKVRVYVRNPDDIHTIHECIESEGISQKETEYLEADICRRPLDVEIEAMIPAY